MKCLITWCWKGKDGPEVTERFKKWKPVGDVKFLFPIHTVIGENRAFSISDVSDVETLARNIQPWTDICTFDIAPIMDSSELVALQ